MIAADATTGASSALVTQIGMWVPLIVAGALWLQPKIKALVTGAAETNESIWNSKRRVAKASRDYAMEDFKTQIGELKDALDEQRVRSERDKSDLERQINEHSRKIEDLRFDLSDTRAYNWAAYMEITRLDPETTFHKPPRLRSSEDAYGNPTP